MTQSERELRRDSSQTLPNGQFYPGIGEDDILDQYQLPKQVHASEAVQKTSFCRETDDLRSYKSLAEIG